MPLLSTTPKMGVKSLDRVVIGIDPSPTATGIVGLDIDTLREYHICIKSRYKGPERLDEVFFLTKRFMDDFTVDIVHICMEDYAFNPLTSSQSHKLGEIGGVIKLGIWTELQMWPTLVTNNQAKKFLLGRGGGKVKITKSQILKGVYTKWGFDTNDDNVADAYVQARIARAIILQQTDTQYEKEVLDSVMPRLLTEAPPEVREKAIASLVYADRGAGAS
jgi:Holliday junction resolvasome RuvABC endonuclease subunit